MVQQAKQRAHDEVLDAITEAASEELAEVGAAALSLRKVARSLGMVSSAIYRYVGSRDELLTLLIVRAYDDLGLTVEQAVFPADPPMERWVAAASAVRQWAVANPHEYALVYGSPVPGYAAPQDTVEPGTRVSTVLAGIVGEAVSSGGIDPPGSTALEGPLDQQVEALVVQLGLDIPPAILVRLITAWSQLFGLVSFELFGQLQGMEVDREALFLEAARGMAGYIGLSEGPAR